MTGLNEDMAFYHWFNMEVRHRLIRSYSSYRVEGVATAAIVCVCVIIYF